MFLITALGGVARHVIDQFTQRQIDHTRKDAPPEESRPVSAPALLPDACQPRLLRRLSAQWEGQIFNLSVEDHLVIVANNHREERLRMRFGDAIDEMDGVLGIRVHRSHWVAQHAIDRIERSKGRVFVALTNGARVPVSRTYLPALERYLRD
ncbi:LytTR family transcriptional regulator DNA-binding domain-containing protein [Shimia biformata]|uniref:LytTR family transcriptional regulator DNA-binding domain-containing protein n=1 Tax=Shimia biformata TaxID=1294299 RepID=UPI0019511435